MLNLDDVQAVTKSNTTIPVIYKEIISRVEAEIKERSYMGLDSLIVNLDAVHIGNTFEDFTEQTCKKVQCVIDYFTNQAFKTICLYRGGAVVSVLISWNVDVVGTTDYYMMKRCCEFAVKSGMEGK